MLQTSDPAVVWLIIVNFVMAAVVLVCCLLVGAGIARELLGRVRRPATHPDTANDHAFVVPELGLTMADGGEPERPAKKVRRMR